MKLEAFTTLDYPSELRSSLWGAMELPAEELAALDWHWSRWSGQAVLRWLSDGGHPRPHLISSHGHTVFHRPKHGWTLQLGCGATLHRKVGIRGENGNHLLFQPLSAKTFGRRHFVVGEGLP